MEIILKASENFNGGTTIKGEDNSKIDRFFLSIALDLSTKEDTIFIDEETVKYYNYHASNPLIGRISKKTAFEIYEEAMKMYSVKNDLLMAWGF